MEGVAGVLFHVDLDVVPSGRGLFDRGDLVARDVAVAAAEVELQRAVDLLQHLQVAGNGRAVERDDGVQPILRGEEEGDGSAEAEPDHAHAAGDLGQRPQALQRGRGVGDALLGVEAAAQLQRLGQAGLVVSGLKPGLEAPEQVRRRHDVAQAGEVLADSPDVVADSVDLLDQQQSGAGAGIRQPHGQVERPVRGLHRLDA